jgi:hypothetical protein
MYTSWLARLGESAGRVVTGSYFIDLANLAMETWLMWLDTGRLPDAIRAGKKISSRYLRRTSVM